MSKEAEEQNAAFMRALADGIDEAMNGTEGPKRLGFALLVYPFGKPDKTQINYVGNGKRGEVLVALKELVARWEGRLQETDTKQ
ncbi:hypothetical protein [Microvirga sp. Mcv34]|uniref:hypothetical protein n=1 Tax=Microvirga sp. Mcv34 TaxID=2926016 RepID=UPI0021C8EEEB|nr:hypothetical protein [Microvirga sp. Mcv34]